VSRSSEDGGSWAAHLEDLDVSDAAFCCPDLTTFCRLDELGLVVVGQRLEPDRAVLACRVLEADDGTEGWCRRCGCVGRPRDTVTRELAHEPLGWRPDHPAGDDPPVPVHRVWACVAPGHQPRGRAAGQAVASWTGLGAGGDRVST
jgi:hypothetical protein